jgi:hypothetical protein
MEHCKTIHHTSVKWLSDGYVLQLFFNLLKQLKLLIKRNKNTAENLDEGWTSDLFFVDLTRHLNTFKKELRDKDKSTTDAWQHPDFQT